MPDKPTAAAPGADPAGGADPAESGGSGGAESGGAESGGHDGPGARALASLWRRFGALLLDWTLCVLVAGFLGPVRASSWPSVVLVFEYAFFVGLFGQTPGMRLAGIRCAPVAGAGVIGVPRAALRGLLLCLVVPALIMDKDRRGLHDRAAGSVMVQA